MLEFLRKYERSLMIVIAVLVIISFCFFGTYSSMGDRVEKKDPVVGRTVDGSKLYYSEVKHLSSLLAMPGIFQRLVVNTGVGDALAQAYFGELKEDWQTRFAKARSAKFYRHATIPELDAREIWQELSPGLAQEMEKLQQMDELSPEFFSLWSKIYSLQEKVPAEWVQRILAYQLRQASLPMDPRLVHGDFSLYGCRTLEDWFGRGFLDLSAQFILNGSAYAQQSVPKKEASIDFARSFSSKKGELRALGLSEREGEAVWQKALGFIRWCDEIGNVEMPQEALSEFAKQVAVIDVYQLPEELRFKTIDDMVLFETYARLACVRSSDPLALPQEMLAVEEIAKRAPELVASVYRAQIGKVDLAALGASLPLKELWDWQVEESHWKELQAQFGYLKQADSEDGRFAVLEKLEPSSRKAVDTWSRIQIVLSRSEWVESALFSSPMEDQEIRISEDWIDGVQIHSIKPFAELLLRSQEQDGEAIEQLKCYRDGNVLYRIENVERLEVLKAFSFAEAKALKRIPVERFLEEQYAKIRTSAPSLFKSETGRWKKLSEVRDTALRMIFKDLYCKFDREMEKELPRRRFETWVKGARQALESQTNEMPNSLWSLQRKEVRVEENSQGDWMSRDAFVLQPGEFSPVHVSSTEGVTFFFLKEKMVSTEPMLEQIRFAKEELSSKAKRRAADRVLEIAKQQGALVYPLKLEEECNDAL